MNILDSIIADKIKEVRQQKELVPAGLLEREADFGRVPASLSAALEKEGSSGIIAEFKRRSPSGGTINEDADPAEIAAGYTEAGAAGLSVLTDRKYFGGTAGDLRRARSACGTPILRKEFIFDEYQVLESKAMGADAILLIAAVLDRRKVRQLAGLARSIGLEVLLEIHGEGELEMIHESVDMVGVNNRDLKKMVTGTETSEMLAEKIPSGFIRISESGIDGPEAVSKLRSYGYRGFLIGEHFMRQENPAGACRDFISESGS